MVEGAGSRDFAATRTLAWRDPDLFDALARIRDPRSGSMPCNVTLITGPSKTGDIELQLTTGVHGPGKWHVIVVRSSRTA